MTEKTPTYRTKTLKLMEAALDLYQVGEGDHALELLDQVTRDDPDLAMAYAPLGLIYQEMGDNIKAESAFRKALELDPENEQARKALAMLLILQGRSDEGIRLLRAVLQTSMGDQDAINGLVIALLDKGSPDQAEQVLQESWEATKVPQIGVRYTRFLLTQEKVDQAYKVIQEVAQYAQTPKVLVELSLLLVIRKEYEKAIETLKDIIRTAPNYDRALRGLAHCYTQTGNVEQALSYADQALSISDSKYPYRNWQAKGEALLAAERYKGTLDAAQKGIELIDPDDLEAQPVLGVLYMQRVNAYLALNDTDAALDELSKGRKVLPWDDVFYIRAIQICLQRDCVDDALLVVEEGLASSHQPEEQWITTGYQLLFQQDRLDEALTFASNMVERNPKALDIIAGYGVDLYTNEKPELTKTIFEQLLKIAPNDLRLRTNLSYVLIGQGHLEPAIQHLVDVVEKPTESGEDALYQHIALCNLGYLYILENHLDDAQALLENVLEIASPDESAFLRVAFWWNGECIPDYAPHPTRSVRLIDAALANLTSIALARGSYDQAQNWAEQLQSNQMNNPLAWEVLATVYQAVNDVEGTKSALINALDQLENSLEREMVESWLSGLG